MKNSDFKKNDFTVMENVFSDVELSFLKRLFKKEFSYEEVLSGSSEYHLKDKTSYMKIILLTEQPSIIKRINELTGYKIREVKARVYYTNSKCKNLSWHNDSEYNDQRVAALRVELSDSPYEGGDFLIRNKLTMHEIMPPKLKLNDGLIFRVDHNELEHMVKPVTSGERKSLIIFLFV